MPDALGLDSYESSADFILNEQGFAIADLGDDQYTQGRPHPMISPDVRLAKLQEAVEDETTGVILLDVVLGYGSHDDMANQLAKPIKEALDNAKAEGRELYVVATVCGTETDPQGYDASVQALTDAGVLVESTNTKAIRLALKLMGYDLTFADKKVVEYAGEKIDLPEPSQKELISNQPSVINIGIKDLLIN